MMRSLFAVLVAVCLTACAAVGLGTSVLGTVGDLVSSPAVTVVGDKVQLEGKRGLILASNAYQGAGALVVPLINADKLPPSQVDKVEILNKRAVALLAGVDKGLTLAQRTAGILSIADELTHIAGR